MLLFNVDERKAFSIDWRKAITTHFMGNLSAMYSEDICNDMLKEVQKQIVLPNFLGDLVVLSDNRYYVLDGTKLKRIRSVNEILPQSDIQNLFLQSIFEDKNWQDCVTQAETETGDFPTIQVTDDLSKFSPTDREIETFDAVLSKYLCGDLKEKFTKQLNTLLAWPSNALAHFIVKNSFHYFLHKTMNGLELRKREVSLNSIEELVNVAFNGVILSQADTLTTFLSNKIIYGLELEFPIRITYWDEESTPPAKGTISVQDRKCECYYTSTLRKSYFSDYWIALVPLGVIQQLIPDFLCQLNTKKKRCEEIFSTNPVTYYNMKDICSYNEISRTFKEVHLPPFAGVNLSTNKNDERFFRPFTYNGKECIFDRENISDTELSESFLVVKINKLPEIRKKEEEQRKNQEKLAEQRKNYSRGW